MSIILHVDMNSFYASVEQAKNPHLLGKPLAIAGNPRERKGIIITCSYEARAVGVYTTMPLFEARKRCPDLIVLPPNFPMYRAASIAMFDILREFSPLVEPVSIDEGYVDVTLLQNPQQVAYEIQQTILTRLKLPCSIGIAPNKFLAKTASDRKKPLGITILRRRDMEHELWPLPVMEMHGVGERTAKKLQQLHIHTIGDLAKMSPYTMKLAMGKMGVQLQERANGIDRRHVNPEAIYDTKSVGNSQTLARDEEDVDALYVVLRRLSDKVAVRLYEKRLVGTTITVHIRDHNWHTVTRSGTLANATQDKRVIYQEAVRLFEIGWNNLPIRLLGVTMNNVMDETQQTEQLSLFTYEEQMKDEPIRQLVEKLTRKFGEGSIQRGISLPRAKGYHSYTSFSKDFLQDHQKGE